MCAGTTGHARAVRNGMGSTTGRGSGRGWYRRAGHAAGHGCWALAGDVPDPANGAAGHMVSGAWLTAGRSPGPTGPLVDVATAEPITGQAVGSTVGQLLARDGGDRQRFCTATLVASQSRSAVVTAAHCVYSPPQMAGATIAPPGQRGWVEATQFVPGVDGQECPFGVWEIEQIAIDPRWQTDPVHDVAFLTPGGARRAVRRGRARRPGHRRGPGSTIRRSATPPRGDSPATRSCAARPTSPESNLSSAATTRSRAT